MSCILTIRVCSPLSQEPVTFLWGLGTATPDNRTKTRKIITGESICQQKCQHDRQKEFKYYGEIHGIHIT